MNQEQKHYYKLAQDLAKRYKVAPDHRQDLIQEAYLAYLESVAKGCSHPDIIQTNMRKAMFNLTNFKQRPVSIPTGGNTYSFLRRMQEEPYENLSVSEKALFHALAGESVSVDTLDQECEDASPEALLSLGMAITAALSEEEASVFRKIALYNYKMTEVASAMGVDKRRVFEIYKNAVDKLKVILG